MIVERTHRNQRPCENAGNQNSAPLAEQERLNGRCDRYSQSNHDQRRCHPDEQNPFRRIMKLVELHSQRIVGRDLIDRLSHLSAEHREPKSDYELSGGTRRSENEKEKSFGPDRYAFK